MILIKSLVFLMGTHQKDCHPRLYVCDMTHPCVCDILYRTHGTHITRMSHVTHIQSSVTVSQRDSFTRGGNTTHRDTTHSKEPPNVIMETNTTQEPSTPLSHVETNTRMQGLTSLYHASIRKYSHLFTTGVFWQRLSLSLSLSLSL